MSGYGVAHAPLLHRDSRISDQCRLGIVGDAGRAPTLGATGVGGDRSELLGQFFNRVAMDSCSY